MNHNERDIIVFSTVCDMVECAISISEDFAKDCEMENNVILNKFIEAIFFVMIKYRKLDNCNLSDRIDLFDTKNNQDSVEKKTIDKTDIREIKTSTIDKICSGAVFDFSAQVVKNYIVTSGNKMSEMEANSFAQNMFDFVKMFLNDRNIDKNDIIHPEYDWNLFCEHGYMSMKENSKLQ